MAHVHIVTADSGWILERLASEISTRLDYVTYSTQVDETADIQYYVTYSAYRRKVSPIEVGYFAHLEVQKEAHDKFFTVAELMDHCVCHARLYEDVIRRHGVDRVTTISPGVDFDEMRPVVKIGVVGRTYHTGRKGEVLVQAVYDTPGIEWHFTGEGWPGPARKVPHGQMGEFYNEMDYILVPALYEGGPMCVAEALACGTPVIAPPVGWVPDFPHIEYKTGDAEDLRRVLQQVVAERQAMRDKVLDRTWEAWARGHDLLFRSLMERHGLAPTPVQGTDASIGQIALLLHGNEGKSLGGPSVRVPQTAKHLRLLGYDVQTGVAPDPIVEAASIVHGFNIWSPVSGVEMARGVRAQGKPFVLSSIFLDLSEREFWQNRIPALFQRVTDPDEIDHQLPLLREQFLRDRAAGRLPVQGAPGHFEAVREMVETADHVILLAENERRALEAIGARPRAASVVRNAVDPERFGTADPALFAETFGVSDYVVCLARLEARKNQLMLLHALRDLDLPIVLVGHGGDQNYYAMLQRYGKENVRFAGRIDPNSPLLPSAIAGARVFTLPSWSEGAPLAALEAAASGANMVLSDRSSEQEYFGAFARYCDPADPASMRRAILEAYDSPKSETERQELRALVEREYSWTRYARETVEVYSQTLADVRAKAVETPAPAVAAPVVRTDAPRPTIVFDMTTSCYHKGRWTGISRFEMSLAQALARRTDLDVRYVAWHDATRRFVRISPDAISSEILAEYHTYAGNTGLLADGFPRGARLIIGGSAWMQNPRYTAGVVEFAQGNGLALTFVVHDIIPCVSPYWFAEGYVPVFERSLSLLLRASSHVIAGSRHTRSDVQRFGLENNIPLPRIGIFRYGDDIGGTHAATTPADETGEAEIPESVAKLATQPFVLNVGAIHARKNHRLLYELWSRLVNKLGKRCPRLVIVGGVAWNGADVARHFREDKRLTDVVHILENIDDVALDWLYDQAMFTIYPSLYEGWGLPVAESLSRGKICIAAKATSVPEIAPELTDLVDPMDFDGWLTRILMYVSSPPSREAREARIRAEYRGQTWDESVEGLLQELVAVSPTLEPRRRYVLGSRLSLSEKDPLSVLCKSGGWHPSESWGAWSAAQSAFLTVRFARPPSGALVLGILAHAIKPSLDCEVWIEGERVGRFTLPRRRPTFVTFHVPERLLAGRTAANIEIRSSKVVQVSTVVANSTDTRSVGLGLIELSLTPVDDFAVADFGLDPGVIDDALPVGYSFWLPTTDRLDRFFATATTRNDAWGVHAMTGPVKLSFKTHDFPGETLELELAYRACATLASPFRALLVASDGRVLGRLEASDSSLHWVRVKIDPELRSLGAHCVIDVVTTTFHSPHDLKIGSTQTRLGIGFFSFAVSRPGISQAASYTERPKLTFGEPLAFNEGAAGHFYLVTGHWHKPEDAGVWSFGRRGRLVLPLKQMPTGGLLVTMSLRVHQLDHIAPALVVIRANDSAPLNVLCTAAKPIDLFLPLDRLQLDPSAPVLELDIEVEAATSPFDISANPDDRLLGVFLSRLMLRDWVPLALGMPIAPGTEVAHAGLHYSQAWTETPLGWFLNGECGRLVLNVDRNGPVRVLAAATNLKDNPVTVRVGLNEAAEPVIIGPRKLVVFDELVEAVEGKATLELSSVGEAIEISRLLIAESTDAMANAVLLEAVRILSPSGVAAPIDLNNASLNLVPDSVLAEALVGSWYAVEPDGAWTDGRPAGFRLSLPIYLEGPLVLVLTMRLYGDVSAGPIEANIKIGDKPPVVLSRLDFNFRDEVIEIDPGLLAASDGFLDVVIWGDQGASPLLIGQSPDPRHLAVFVQAVHLRTM